MIGTGRAVARPLARLKKCATIGCNRMVEGGHCLKCTDEIRSLRAMASRKERKEWERYLHFRAAMRSCHKLLVLLNVIFVLGGVAYCAFEYGIAIFEWIDAGGCQ